MRRRDFLKAATAPIIVGTLGVSLTARPIKSQHYDTINMDDLMPHFQVGDIIHVPRTRECMLIQAVENGKVKLVRGFGNTHKQAIAADDTVEIIGNIIPGPVGETITEESWLETARYPSTFKGRDLEDR